MSKIICFEGVEGIGKSKIISELMYDYGRSDAPNNPNGYPYYKNGKIPDTDLDPDPYFIRSSLPSVFREEIEQLMKGFTKYNEFDLNQLEVYHRLFILDVLFSTTSLESYKITYDQHMLLEGHALSRLPYAKFDLTTRNLQNNQKISSNIVRSWNDIRFDFYNLLDRVTIPDIIILLRGYSSGVTKAEKKNKHQSIYTEEQLLQIDSYYSKELNEYILHRKSKGLKEPAIYVVEALRGDTSGKVKMILYEEDIL